MGPTSLSRSALMSNLLAVLILVLVVDDVSSSLFKFKNKAKSEPTPLYGIVLHGHPYHNRIPSIPSPHSSYYPFYPNPPVYLPQVQPRPLVYYPPPPPPPPPPKPAPYQPLPVYSPPVQALVAPTYKPPTTYRPPSARPTPYPVHPAPLPVPTTFDVKPWTPLSDSISSASYVLDPAVQLNTVDGYPWTESLEEDADTELVKSKLPEILFQPSKSLAQQHSSATNINFNPNPERPPNPLNNRLGR